MRTTQSAILRKLGVLLLLALLVALLPTWAFAQTITTPTSTPQLDQWALIVGFLLPPVISLIVQSNWSAALKSGVAFLVCLVCGAVTAYLQGLINPLDLAGTVLTVLVTAIATYKGFWHPTGISPGIERGSSA